MKKIPSEILIAPPDYLPPQMIEAFRQIGYGAIPQWTNMGCSLFIHIDSKTIHDCHNALHSVKLELHEVEGFPLIRLDITVYDRPDDPLRMDCFLDITSEHDMPTIEALTEQEWLVFHWYNEDLKYVRSSAIRWPEQQRKDARIILERAKEIISRNPMASFTKAKAKFIADNPL